jgi:diguanylate cyclase (GGDEF)-like protein
MASAQAGTASTGTIRRLVGSNGTIKVWMLTAVIAAFSFALYELGVRRSGSLPSPLHVSWWMVAVLFYLTEVFVVHIQFQRDAHSFSLSEIPLIIGLFFLSPTGLIAARLVGSASALVVNRRQAPLKLFFNLNHFVLGTCLAIIVFMPAASLGAPLGPMGWAAASLAAIVSLVVGDVVIDTAMYLSGGGLPVKTWAQMLGLGLVSTAANTILALTAVTILWKAPRAAWLVLALATIFFFSYRAYTRERQKHESLELLYESTHIVQRSAHVEPAVQALLRHLRKMFKAEIAQLTLFPADGDARALCTSLGPGESADLMRRIDIPPIEAVWTGASPDDDAVVLSGAAGNSTYRQFFSSDYTKDAMVAPLRGETRVVGAVMVANRLGNVETFNAEDLRLLATIASHTSIALENGRLEKTLAQVTQLEEQLRHQAFHDPLTELANRALFKDRLEHALANRARSPRPLAVLFLDLDDFKTVNDSLGHEAGDELLVAVAKRLKKCLRPSDTAARLGGDEFAVLFEEVTHEGEAVPVAERIVQSLGAPFIVNGNEIVARGSAGLAVSTHGAEAADDLLRNADVAMYRAKSSGKGRYEVFEEGMHVAARQRLLLTNEMRHALELGQFVLHYQPYADLQSGAIVGLEALVRWRHPERGLLLPGEFIPVAEDAALILPIGRWVLEEACRHARAWHEASSGADHLIISVNVSSRQLLEPGFVADVASLLEGTDLGRGRLMLEITESVFMEETSLILSRLAMLKELGVLLAIDDFGTGYSSLGYLKRFPLDVLKIAKSFIDEIGDGPGDSALIQAIVEMAKTMRLRTIAEGIEQKLQWTLLRSLECDMGQGFHIARPLDESSVMQLLCADGAVDASSSSGRDRHGAVL